MLEANLRKIFVRQCETVLAMSRSMAGRKEFEKRVERASTRASKRTRIETFPKLTEVVDGQHLMQAASDVFLGWSTFNGRDYYARQLRDMKWSAEVEAMDLTLFTGYVELCAATLARAHARTGDSAQMSGYLGNKDTFEQAIASFAEVYADQAEHDHAALLAAIKAGRVQAQTDV